MHCILARNTLTAMPPPGTAAASPGTTGICVAGCLKFHQGWIAEYQPSCRAQRLVPQTACLHGARRGRPQEGCPEPAQRRAHLLHLQGQQESVDKTALCMYTVALQALQGYLLMPPDHERTPGRLSVAGRVCSRSAAQSWALAPGDSAAASSELVALRLLCGLVSAFTNCTAAGQELDGTQGIDSANTSPLWLHAGAVSPQRARPESPGWRFYHWDRSCAPVADMYFDVVPVYRLRILCNHCPHSLSDVWEDYWYLWTPCRQDQAPSSANLALFLHWHAVMLSRHVDVLLGSFMHCEGQWQPFDFITSALTWVHFEHGLVPKMKTS